MRVIVPFDPANPNTRLSSLLSVSERREFAAAMLVDVLAAVREAGGEPELLASAPLAEHDEIPTDALDVPVTVDDRPLSEAVNAALEEDLPAAVVMADLALATPDALASLFDTASDVVVAPGRGGGTNALVVRHPEFAVDYHGVSYRDHVDVAAAVGASVATVDSFRLALDVDEPADLLDVLVHGERVADRREATNRASGDSGAASSAVDRSEATDQASGSTASSAVDRSETADQATGEERPASSAVDGRKTTDRASAAVDWLRDAGFRVVVEDGEPRVVRGE